MPPPSSQRGDIEPPPEVMTEAMKGFFTGAVRYGSLSILAHLILLLPHPMNFTAPSTPPTAQSSSAPSPYPSRSPRRQIPSLLVYRPLTWVSSSLGPASRVYRGLTPQFKVFLQMAAMTLGGCIWAEKRVREFQDAVRREKRAERRRREYGDWVDSSAR